MRRRPLLNPRLYRFGDYLRRPLTPDIALGSGGGDLSVGGASGWGFGGAAAFRGVTIPAPLSLSVWAEGTPVFPAGGVYRPSHVTVHSRDSDTGLQVSEDKFVAPDDVLVSVLSLRNPGEGNVEVEIRARWGIDRGEHTGADGAVFWASRFAPNAADRRFTLASGGRTRLVFALALASDGPDARIPGDTARRRAESYIHDTGVVIAQTNQSEEWADKNTPRFDCPDAWAARAWANDRALLRKYPRRAPFPVSDQGILLAEFVEDVKRRFSDNDFDALADDPAPFLPDVFVRGVLRLAVSGDILSIRPAPDLIRWKSFCVENYVAVDRCFTIVWDSPDAPGDAYDDGDKGFTVYDRDTMLHKQPGLSPFTLTMPLAAAFTDAEDE